MIVEINFDGIIGPSHNYAGLSLGNLAATRNAGAVAHPRAAALEGITKMRTNLALGLAQGVLLPHARPNREWLRALGTDVATASSELRANAMSASAMWAANAATVSPAADTGDGRCHLTVANLATMPHRSHEWPGTLAQLRVAFADTNHFIVHAPVPGAFGDEGAANHMRIGRSHGAAGVEVFVYGASGGPFPARQHVEASRAVARLHGLDPSRTLFARQSAAAIAAGAFHNDVVAVANEHVLFAHEDALAEAKGFYDALRTIEPDVAIVEVASSEVSLADAVASYLFNAQLVTPSDGVMTLIVPTETQEIASVRAYLARMVAGNGPIRRVEVVDVRQSMANGGGPACLRLRVVADPATVDQRFMVGEAKLDRIAAVIEALWPVSIAPDDLGDTALVDAVERARTGLLEEVRLQELM